MCVPGRWRQRGRRAGSHGGAPAEDDGLLDGRGIHDGAHVVEQDAHVWSTNDTVRHPDAALVEKKHTEVVREPADEGAKRGCSQ